VLIVNLGLTLDGESHIEVVLGPELPAQFVIFHLLECTLFWILVRHQFNFNQIANLIKYGFRPFIQIGN